MSFKTKIPTAMIRPQTLEGIKRLAKRIEVEQFVKYDAALNTAAIQSGYASFEHARQALTEGKPNAH